MNTFGGRIPGMISAVIKFWVESELNEKKSFTTEKKSIGEESHLAEDIRRNTITKYFIP